MTKKREDRQEAEQKRVLEKALPEVNKQVGGDFTKIDSNERKQILLRAAPHARQPSMLWTKDRKLMKKFFVKRFIEFHDQFECEFAGRASYVLGEVDRELDLAGTENIFFNIRCEESTIFFHLPRIALSSRDGLLIVRLPKEIYEIQRRAQLRYRSLGEADGFSIESDFFNPWKQDLTVLDVSAGGIGVQIKFETTDLADAFKLRAETRLPFKANFGAVNFLAQGEVRYLKSTIDEITGVPVVRIGLRFVGLPQDTVEAIQLLVLEHSYSRLKDMFTG